MGTLANVSGKQAIAVFKKFGWSINNIVGSHVVMTKKGSPANLSVPKHDELGVGLLRKLIRLAGLTVAQFTSKL